MGFNSGFKGLNSSVIIIHFFCGPKDFNQQFFSKNFISSEVKSPLLMVQAYLPYLCTGKGKVKAIPLQAWTGPEGSRKLRLPYFKTIGT